MRARYGALRPWSTVLIVVGIGGMVFVAIGTVVAFVGARTFGQALAMPLIGPLAALFASWPLALGQGCGRSPTSQSTPKGNGAGSGREPE